MTKPLNILIWQWLHDRLEKAWHWVWNKKLSPYYFPKDALPSPGILYSEIYRGEDCVIYRTGGSAFPAENRCDIALKPQVEKKWEGPIYDLMRAYSALTYGNMYPRVAAGDAAKKWVHEYTKAHSSLPHRENYYGETQIEWDDLPEDTFKFFLDGDVKERFMNSWRERHEGMFGDGAEPPNLEPIIVKVPCDIALNEDGNHGR